MEKTRQRINAGQLIWLTVGIAGLVAVLCGATWHWMTVAVGYLMFEAYSSEKEEA